jgi:DNA repair protein RadC
MVTSQHPFPPSFRTQLVREAPTYNEISCADDVAEVLSTYLQTADTKHFVVLLLNARNRMIGLVTVHVGALTMSVVSASQVFKAAILGNACSIILAHNHPSGDPSPSPEDIEVTRKLIAAGALLDIEVIDHIITGENGVTYSFLQHGFISSLRQ